MIDGHSDFVVAMLLFMAFFSILGIPLVMLIAGQSITLDIERLTKL